MARQTRKEMKHDEFVDTAVVIIQRIQDNPRPYALGAAGVVALALGTWGVLALIANRSDQSAESFSRALAALSAPVTATAPATPQDPYRPVFDDVSTRNAESLSRLDEAVESGGRAARLASYLKGVQLLRDGQREAALEALASSAAALGDDPTMGVLVKASHASALGAAGRGQEAVEIWGSLAAEDSGYPRDLALQGLARAAEDAGDDERARSTLRTLVEEFPGSPAVPEAEAALARLGG